MKSVLKQSALLTGVGRWMPLGAITILAVCCMAAIDPTEPPHGIPEVLGVAITVAVHRWRRNAVLSIVSGTAACLLMTNWALPG